MAEPFPDSADTAAAQGWRCPVCGGRSHRRRFRRSSKVEATADNFRPSTEMFGRTSGEVVVCLGCGHGSLSQPPPQADVMTAYADAADPVSVREEAGQVETGRRAMAAIERFVAPGTAVDLGCWTGSYLVAARDRGWRTVGVEPSAWAAERARERGIEVHERDLFEHGLAAGTARLVILCDVLEHLVEPAAALAVIQRLLEPGGVVFITVPNAGSALARLLGRRWWSVLPMHLQYFTRRSLRLLLERAGFEVLRMETHAKAFSARYYAERLSGYSGTVGGAAVAALEGAGAADRMVAPDFRDRLGVIARRP